MELMEVSRADDVLSLHFRFNQISEDQELADNVNGVTDAAVYLHGVFVIGRVISSVCSRGVYNVSIEINSSAHAKLAEIGFSNYMIRLDLPRLGVNKGKGSRFNITESATFRNMVITQSSDCWDCDFSITEMIKLCGGLFTTCIVDKDFDIYLEVPGSMQRDQHNKDYYRLHHTGIDWECETVCLLATTKPILKLEPMLLEAFMVANEIGKLKNSKEEFIKNACALSCSNGMENAIKYL